MAMRKSWMVLLVPLVLFPIAAEQMGIDFYISYASRIIIFAIAATGLNLILGYGGMVALGHAAFLGIGSYTLVIMSEMGVNYAPTVWLIAMVSSAAAALVIGFVSLRTVGVYFIMITLAFAQMVYYIFVSLRQFGGEDGFNLYSRSIVPLIDTDDDFYFYYVVLALAAISLFLFSRIVGSHFGKALVGIRENESRMLALGYPVYRIKLAAFVLSGVLTGLAGVLLADLNQFASPGVMHWTQSAHLLIMVLVGGMGLLYGGVIGAAIILVFEEVLRNYTEFWHLPMGLLLLVILFMAPRGLASILNTRVE